MIDDVQDMVELVFLTMSSLILSFHKFLFNLLYLFASFSVLYKCSSA